MELSVLIMINILKSVFYIIFIFGFEKAPSHVAQYDTLFPLNLFSPGTPTYLGCAPVAMIIALASHPPYIAFNRGWSLSLL